MELPDTSSRNEQSIMQYKTSLYSVIVSGNIVEAKGIIDEILSDDVSVTVSKRVLLSFAGDLGKFEAKDWKEIADYTLPMIEPRVEFKEQAEMITSKMNCLDRMRGSIDKLNSLESLERQLTKLRKGDLTPENMKKIEELKEQLNEMITSGTTDALFHLADLVKKDRAKGEHKDAPMNVIEKGTVSRDQVKKRIKDKLPKS